MKAVGITTIPVHWRAVSISPSAVKNDGKIVPDYFAILAIILPYWENRHYLTCEQGRP